MPGPDQCRPPKPVCIVVCENDAATLNLLCEQLAADRFEVLAAPSAEAALRLCRYKQSDLLLLDLTLPSDTALNVVKEIRGSTSVASRLNPKLPIILLDTPDTEAARVRGLEWGADDYLRKPYHYRLLRRAIEVLLRSRELELGGPIRAGEIVIYPGERRVAVGGAEVKLSVKEFALLRLLAGDPYRVFSKRELLAGVWGDRSAVRTRTLDSHVARLRRKLDPERARFVINCWGVGYRLLDGSGETQSADLVEYVSQPLPRAGREIVDSDT
jgi:DNA-binding response OmpR family regulator